MFEYSEEPLIFGFLSHFSLTPNSSKMQVFQEQRVNVSLNFNRPFHQLIILFELCSYSTVLMSLIHHWPCCFPQPRRLWCCSKRCSLFSQSRITMMIRCFSQAKHLKEGGRWVSHKCHWCVFVVVLCKICKKPKPRLCLMQFLCAASRGHKISIIHEDGLFLHMKLFLDTNCDHFLLFLLPVSLFVTTIVLFVWLVTFRLQ